MAEEQRKQIIEERAKFIYESATWNSDDTGYRWDDIPNEDQVHYFELANEQLDWFRSHGMDIPEKYVEAKIPEEEHPKINGWDYSKDYYDGRNKVLSEIKKANPNGLYTKEVNHD